MAPTYADGGSYRPEAIRFQPREDSESKNHRQQYYKKVISKVGPLAAQRGYHEFSCDFHLQEF